MSHSEPDGANDGPETTVRCFRTKIAGSKGYGVWAMTTETRGVFYKGNGYERQAPRWSVADLVKPDSIAVEISPAEALNLLAYWPEAQADLRKVFGRHPVWHESPDGIFETSNP